MPTKVYLLVQILVKCVYFLGNSNKSSASNSDLISWEQFNEVKKENELEKLFEMKSTVNQLYQQHSQVLSNLHYYKYVCL